MLTLGQVEPSVGGLHQLQDLLLTPLGVLALERGQGGTHDDGRVLSVEPVLSQQVPHLHLDEFQHLGVVDLVDLVDKDQELVDTDLLGEEQVFLGLRHLTVSGRDDDDGSVQLGGTGNHVLRGRDAERDQRRSPACRSPVPFRLTLMSRFQRQLLTKDQL